MVTLRLVLPVVLLLFGSAARAAPSPLAIGSNLLGQTCTAQSHYAESAGSPAPTLFDLSCGAPASASGSLQITPLVLASTQQLHEALAAKSKASEFSAAAALRLVCFPGHWLSLDDAEYLLAACTMRESGWPALTVVGWRNGRMVEAEGPAAFFPLVQSFLFDHPVELSPEQRVLLQTTLETALGSKLVLLDGSQTASFQALNENARIQDSLGNYEEAEEDFRQALALQKTALGGDGAAAGESLMHLALEISNQGRFNEAQDLFKAAEPMLQTSVDPIDDARLVSYLALDAANRHDFAAARDLARRATEARRALADNGGGNTVGMDRGNSRALVNTYLARGEMVQSRLLEALMSERLNDLSAAGEAAAEAVEIAQSTPGVPTWWRAEAMSAMGEIEGKLGHPKVGEPMLKDAIALERSLFGAARPTALAWFALGRFHADQGNYAEALPDFRQGLVILAKLRQSQAAMSFDTVAPYFSAAIEVADHNPSQHDQLLSELFVILQCVQKGKESQISDRSFSRLAQANPAVATAMRDLQDAENTRDQMRLSLATEQAKPADRRDGGRLDWYEAQFHEAEAKAQRFDAALQGSTPEYRRLVHPGLVTLADLQSVLKPGELFITFAFGEEFGLVFAASHQSVEVRALAVSARQLGQSISELREGIIVRGGRVGHFDLALANELYRRLLLPIQASLHDAEHLVVATSGALASLPLAALVTQVPQSDDLTAAAWLIRKADISQVPLAAAFMALRWQSAPSQAPRRFLGIGNPLFTGGDGGISGALSRCGNGLAIPPEILAGLPPLPDTAVELRNVAKAVGAGEQDLLLGAGATEAALRARPLDQYRILYFATHGLLPTELRCQDEPALALSPPVQPATSKAEDGLLEASEIAALKLDADLVVLSACNTATGAGKFGGDSLASLADMFFYAGSRAVLATHWSIPSASTTKLMTSLFERHATAPELSYAQALRQAQLTMLADPATAQPLHWAGFSLIGGTGPHSVEALAEAVR